MVELSEFERGQIVAALGYGGLSRLDTKLKDKLMRPPTKPEAPVPGPLAMKAEG